MWHFQAWTGLAREIFYKIALLLHFALSVSGRLGSSGGARQPGFESMLSVSDWEVLGTFFNLTRPQLSLNGGDDNTSYIFLRETKYWS